jgi:hypothetical protein
MIFYTERLTLNEYINFLFAKQFPGDSKFSQFDVVQRCLTAIGWWSLFPFFLHPELSAHRNRGILFHRQDRQIQILSNRFVHPNRRNAHRMK